MSTNRIIATTIALFAAAALAGPATAQGRHDDKPHGYDKQKAAATAAKTDKAEGPTVGGRHDEKPHGMKKAKPAQKSADAPAKPAAGTAPAAPASAPSTAK